MKRTYEVWQFIILYRFSLFFFAFCFTSDGAMPRPWCWYVKAFALMWAVSLVICDFFVVLTNRKSTSGILFHRRKTGYNQQCMNVYFYYLFLGPATVRMISENGPAFPLPLHLPPGHMVQQVLDENGVLTHVIMSQPGPPPPPPPHHHMVWMDSYTKREKSK